MKTTSLPHTAVLLATSLSTVVGCVGLPEDIAQESQALYTYAGTHFFTERSNNVPVCWATPGFVREKALIQSSVENSWGRVANLRFSWADCANVGSQPYVRVTVRTMTEDGGTTLGTGTGTLSTLNPSVYIDVRTNGTTSDARIQYTAVHEFGHVLGFQHEQDQPGLEPTQCRIDYCRRTVSAANLDACLQGASIHEDGTPIGPYDPQSVMNYCGPGIGVLSPGDVIGVQHVYGRKPAHSIVGLGGRCVTIRGAQRTYRAQVIAYDCNGQDNDTWGYDFRSQNATFVTTYPENRLQPYVLGVASSSVTTGNTPLETQPPTALSTQRWRFNGVQWRAQGELCVGAHGAATDSVLETQTCNGSALQSWDFEAEAAAAPVPGGWSNSETRVRLHGTGYCANVSGGRAVVGAQMVLFPCGTPAYPNERLVVGSLKNRLEWGGLCLNVWGGSTAPGSALRLYGCGPSSAPNANEQFHITGRITSVASGRCLDMNGGVSGNNVPLGAYPCVAGASNQEWDYYW